MNTNGHLTFRSEFLEWIPRPFPIVGLPLIAPYWEDVDIRRFGTIFYRQTSSPILLQRARNELQELFPSSGNFNPTRLVIATWDRVAGFGLGSLVCAYMTTHFSTTSLCYCLQLLISFGLLCSISAMCIHEGQQIYCNNDAVFFSGPLGGEISPPKF